MVGPTFLGVPTAIALRRQKENRSEKIFCMSDLSRSIDHEIHNLDQLNNQTFNVGGGSDVSVSLCELTEMCPQITGNKIEIQSVPENRQADIRIYITDNSKFESATGWSPESDLGYFSRYLHLAKEKRRLTATDMQLTATPRDPKELLMKICLITGSAGLIGSEAVEFFSPKFDLVIGIDNNMRQYFFGEQSSTHWNVQRLKQNYSNYKHFDIDIRDSEALQKLFEEYQKDIALIIHTAAQPSHDWAAKEPLTDFTINANGTLNLLEFARQFCPESVFIFTSTNKVYGDTPNLLPLVEFEKRWELDQGHSYYENGIDEEMSIDQTKHSLFGVSKVAADVLVQEYGRYFNMKTGVFRGAV